MAPRGKPLPGLLQNLVTWRFLASGMFHPEISDFCTCNHTSLFVVKTVVFARRVWAHNPGGDFTLAGYKQRGHDARIKSGYATKACNKRAKRGCRLANLGNDSVSSDSKL